MNWGRLLRIYTLIAAVSTVSFIVFAGQFTDPQLSILSVAIGTVALVSAILGALLAGEAFVDEPSADRTPGAQDSGSQ